MKPSSLLYATLLSLSPHSIYASLPYSIPDLERYRLFDRAVDTERQSLSTHTTASASSLAFESGPSNLGSLPSSQRLAHNTSSFNSGGRISPTGHPSRDSSPFPTSSNTTITQRSSIGSITSSKIAPQQPFPSPRVSFANTTLTDTITRSFSSSPTPSTPAHNVTSTVTNSERPSLNSTVIFVTITPSIGSPIVVTQTQSQLRPSTLPSSSQGRLSTVPSTYTSPSASSNGGVFASLFPSRSPLPPSGGGLASMFTGQVPQSSGTPTENDQPRATFPSLFVVDALIEDQAYHLPHPDQPPIEILLADGSLAQLFATKVVLRGQNLMIPDNGSGEQTVSSGGQAIKTRPGESKTPESDDSDGGSSGGGPFGLLSKLAGAAGSAAQGIGNAASGLVNFATGAAGAGGESAGQLAGTLSGAVSGASTVVSSLNGIQKSFPLDEFTKNGMNTFLRAQNLGRGALDWMQSTGKMLETFDDLKPDVQQKLRDNIRDYTKPDGPLFKASDALKALSDFPWESEAPTTERPTPTATPDQTKSAQETFSTPPISSLMSTTASTTIRSTTVSSSSATPTLTEEPISHFILTKDGTSLETFNRFIQELDEGAGKAVTHDMSIIDHQSYTTNLTRSQAVDLLDKYSFLLLVYARVFDIRDLENGDGESFHAIPRPTTQAQNMKLISEERKVGLRTSAISPLAARTLRGGVSNAPYWKKMISSPFQNPLLRAPAQDPPYLADDADGRGITIYVLDDGFDISLSNLSPQPQGRTIETFFISNDLAFPPGTLEGVSIMMPNAFIKDAQLNGAGHGTLMASIAAGRDDGIAPQANLYLLKMKGTWNTGNANSANNRDRSYATQPDALAQVLDRVRLHVRNRLIADPDTKSVINMSWGIKLSERNGPPCEAILRVFIDWCETFKIPVVAAAGNDPTLRLHETVPQKFGKADNTLITVGGVEPNGKLFPPTTPAEPGESGSMSVYAPARDVVVPGSAPGGHSGTSQAAAIVSGLAAYLYSVEGLGLFHAAGIPPPKENIKRFIVEHAWTRVPEAQLGPLPHLNVVYNLAAGDPAHPESPCAVPDFPGIGKRADEAASACSRLRTPTASLMTPTSTSPSISHTATVRSSDISNTRSSSSRVTPSGPPASSTMTPSAPTPPVAPPSEQCRIYVKEYDNADPNQLGEDIWNISIFPITGEQLKDNSPICTAGARADERTGVDVQCEPLGGPLHLQREKDRTLRLIFGKETWTGGDKNCNLVKDWYVFDTTQPDERRRETECRFECKVDWTKKPTFFIGLRAI
ncbi:peptidase S8/S53 domain-containing protein [Paraphoma chrysanthemicola]|uniref:Peptidase S8/S53 domain-containing protein n=1 Tax=Paraphoma chrysanthemicola TaxID=798071 RepID=A0A8K0R8Y4_9PLEO|nr:peptidase S8/S53 domain-containing protein [Paraphoma chrysanthemicola]